MPWLRGSLQASDEQSTVPVIQRPFSWRRGLGLAQSMEKRKFLEPGRTEALRRFPGSHLQIHQHRLWRYGQSGKKGACGSGLQTAGKHRGAGLLRLRQAIPSVSGRMTSRAGRFIRRSCRGGGQRRHQAAPAHGQSHEQGADPGGDLHQHGDGGIGNPSARNVQRERFGGAETQKPRLFLQRSTEPWSAPGVPRPAGCRRSMRQPRPRSSPPASPPHHCRSGRG